MPISEEQPQDNLESVDDHHATVSPRGAVIGTFSPSNIDVAITPEQAQDQHDRVYGSIARVFDEQLDAFDNLRRAQRFGSGRQNLIPSPVGRPALIANADWIYHPPKIKSIRPRPPNQPAFLFVVHSFGKGFDIGFLRANRRRVSVDVDPATGYSPHRFYNGMRSILTGPRPKVSVHHGISRRGDVVNSVGWNYEGSHAGAPRGAPYPSGNRGSIGLELEEWYVKPSPGVAPDRVTHKVPYTEQQYLALAFLFKKFVAWTGIPENELARWHGPLGDECHEKIRNRVPGCIQHSDIRPRGDAGGEFFFPPDYRSGDPLPQYLRESRPRKFQGFVDRWWGDTPGVYISGWSRLFTAASRMRTFDRQTELFDAALSTEGRLEITPVTPTFGGNAGISQGQARDAGLSLDRSQQAQGASRREIYSQAGRTNGNIAATFDTARHNNAAAIRAASREPANVINPLSFNFETGLWERGNGE